MGRATHIQPSDQGTSHQTKNITFRHSGWCYLSLDDRMICPLFAILFGYGQSSLSTIKRQTKINIISQSWTGLSEKVYSTEYLSNVCRFLQNTTVSCIIRTHTQYTYICIYQLASCMPRCKLLPCFSGCPCLRHSKGFHWKRHSFNNTWKVWTRKKRRDDTNIKISITYLSIPIH